MHLPGFSGKHRLGLMGCMGLLALGLSGCDNSTGILSTGGQAGGGLFGGAQAGAERWTIRCTRIETPDHKEAARVLAEMLGKVPGIRARDVRVVSDATGSTIYYGQYVKETSSTGGLGFPENYRKDIELIRSLAYRQQTPFFFAGPELLTPSEPAGRPAAPGDVSTAKGTHSLLIAVFYNTPEFRQRQEAAETYVKDLRERGYPAYYYHQAVRSFVYVGDFDAQDLVQTPEGKTVYGPRVEQFIARNPDEFKSQTENGHFLKRTLPDGTVVAPPVLLVPLPGVKTAAEPAPAPRPMPPGA